MKSCLLNKLKAVSYTPSYCSVIIMAGFKMSISNKSSAVIFQWEKKFLLEV